MGSNSIHNLLSQIFDEDQGRHKDICFSHIGTETGVVDVVAQFFDQVAAQLDPKLSTCCIQSGRRLGQRVLILRFQNHIHRFHNGFVVLSLHRSNATIGGADLCEHLRTLSNVKNHTASRRSSAKIQGWRNTAGPIGSG